MVHHDGGASKYSRTWKASLGDRWWVPRRRSPWSLAVYLVAAGAIALVLGQAIWVDVWTVADRASAYSGTVVGKGTTYTLSRYPENPYLVLRHSDGTTERRYLRDEDFAGISVGDSAVKRSGRSEHTRVVRSLRTSN
jgi:hypothetical protein